jgi:hypothetical protein
LSRGPLRQCRQSPCQIRAAPPLGPRPDVSGRSSRTGRPADSALLRLSRRSLRHEGQIEQYGSFTVEVAYTDVAGHRRASPAGTAVRTARPLLQSGWWRPVVRVWPLVAGALLQRDSDHDPRIRRHHPRLDHGADVRHSPSDPRRDHHRSLPERRRQPHGTEATEQVGLTLSRPKLGIMVSLDVC